MFMYTVLYILYTNAVRDYFTVAGLPAWPETAVGIYTVGSTIGIVESVLCRLFGVFGYTLNLTHGCW
jgi:hypothetical protein